ncbi:hypothetical protein F511_22169 [Dorcoceras hygrometricum]|uniref:Uncharacterized protein n=1 Tax=Dorcoceras hygrometricum TaxID=472368 RepID=A0A2Z7BVC3_9LAMI|nr:hypothetical protein F511_22169 [Dorcoceras hygrometricum]
MQELESAMMTSAVMSSQSTVDKKRKSWISDDDVSSDVITISSELQYNQSMTQAKMYQSQALQDQRLDNQLKACLRQLVNQSLAHLDHQLMYQSQATVYPVAGYSVLYIQSTGNPDAGKADIVKSCKPDADSYNQTQRIQTQRS